MKRTYPILCAAPRGPTWPLPIPPSKETTEPPTQTTVKGTAAMAGPAPPRTCEHGFQWGTSDNLYLSGSRIESLDQASIQIHIVWIIYWCTTSCDFVKWHSRGFRLFCDALSGMEASSECAAGGELDWGDRQRYCGRFQKILGLGYSAKHKKLDDDGNLMVTSEIRLRLASCMEGSLPYEPLRVLEQDSGATGNWSWRSFPAVLYPMSMISTTKAHYSHW